MTNLPDIDLSAIDEAMASACHAKPLMGSSVTRLLDLEPQELTLVLDKAVQLKESWSVGESQPLLEGRVVALALGEPSLRERVSFEVALARLGARPVGSGSLVEEGEDVQDAVLALERYVDCIIAKAVDQATIEEAADWSAAPVINAGTEEFAPCVGLADALTIREKRGDLKGLTLAFVGNGASADAHTCMELAAIAGMDICIGCPEGYEPFEEYVEECCDLASEQGTGVLVTSDPVKAVSEADVIITAAWGLDDDEAAEAFEGFQVDEELMLHAPAGALFIHHLPAHRWGEVSDEVMESDLCCAYDAAENRLYVQQALLALLMGA